MKSYNTIFITSVLAVIIMTVALNFIVDPYHVLNSAKLNKRFDESNLRFLKGRHLDRNRQNNAFIMGSSRVNFYDAKKASNFSGLDFYNFSVSAEKCDRILQKLKWLVETRDVRHVLIGLDYDFMFLSDDLPEDALKTKEYYKISKESAFDFYFPYIFQFQWKNWIRALKWNIFEKKEIEFAYDFEIGRLFFINLDKQIEDNHDMFIKDHFEDKLPYEGNLDNVSKNVNHLRNLITFLKTNNIDYTVIINPCYYSVYESFDQDLYKKWLTDVIEICGRVWDFSSTSKNTQNKYLFYESSHFREPLGEIVLSRVFARAGYDMTFGKLLDIKNRPLAVKGR